MSQASASGLSPVQADKPWSLISADLAQHKIFCFKVCDILLGWYKSKITTETLTLAPVKSDHDRDTVILNILFKEISELVF